MADTTIGVRLEADDQVSPKVKTIKEQLKLANAEVIAMTEKFGVMSVEAANAAKKAADLKDTIDDGRKLIDAFNPDTKFRAFGASINTVVGGFTALTGVMGLVGVKSKEVEGLLLKVQSALALSQGIAQLQEGIKSFKNLSAVIQSTTIFQKANNAATTVAAVVQRVFTGSVDTTTASFGRLKIAIALTGIGLLVIGLAAASKALGLFSDDTEDAATAQKELEQAVSNTNDALNGQLNIFARNEKLAIAQAKQRGATEKEIFEIEQFYRRLRFGATTEQYEKLKGLDDIAAAKALQSLKDQNAEGAVAQIEFDLAEQKRNKDKHDKISEQNKRASEERLKQARKEFEEETKARAGKITGTVDQGLLGEVAKSPEQLQFEREAKERHDLRIQEQLDLEQRAAFKNANHEIELAQSEERIAQEQVEYEVKAALTDATINILSGLSQLLGQHTVAGKILAVAEATISTYAAIAKTLRAYAGVPVPGFAIAQAIATGIFGLVQVKRILSVKVPGAGGGGGALPSLAVSAPLTPQRPQGTTTSLDQNSLNAIGSATTRAFVLEADVSNSQERITRLNRAARL